MLRVKLDAPELPNIIVNEQAVRQLKHRTCVFARHGVPEQISCHAQVDIEQTAIEGDKDLLSVPAN